MSESASIIASRGDFDRDGVSVTVILDYHASSYGVEQKRAMTEHAQGVADALFGTITQ